MFRKKNIQESAEKKPTSYLPSFSYFKRFLPSTPALLTTDFTNLAKLATYFNLMSYLPTVSADNLYILLEQVKYAVTSNSSETLQDFKTKLIDACASNLTILEGPQGNYSVFDSLICKISQSQVDLSIADSTNTEPLEKCADAAVQQFQKNCFIMGFEYLVVIGLILGLLAYLKNVCKNSDCEFTNPCPREAKDQNIEENHENDYQQIPAVSRP
jgi:hypothetical protein